MNKLRLAIDSNVFISALLSKKSNPFKVVKFAFENKILLSSDETFAEIERVIFRKKFDKYLSNEERYIFLAKLMVTAEKIDIVEHFNICRDTKDNCFLDLAVNGNVDFLITGDNDLLVLNPFRGIEIITSEVFVSRFIES